MQVSAKNCNVPCSVIQRQKVPVDPSKSDRVRYNSDQGDGEKARSQEKHKKVGKSFL